MDKPALTGTFRIERPAAPAPRDPHTILVTTIALTICIAAVLIDATHVHGLADWLPLIILNMLAWTARGRWADAVLPARAYQRTLKKAMTGWTITGSTDQGVVDDGVSPRGAGPQSSGAGA